MKSPYFLLIKFQGKNYHNPIDRWTFFSNILFPNNRKSAKEEALITNKVISVIALVIYWTISPLVFGWILIKQKGTATLHRFLRKAFCQTGLEKLSSTIPLFPTTYVRTQRHQTENKHESVWNSNIYTMCEIWDDTSQSQCPGAWQVLVRAMGGAGLFLTALNLSPTITEWSFAFTGNLCARFREKLTLEEQDVDSQSTGCPLVREHKHHGFAGHSIKYSWLDTVFCRGKSSSKAYSKNQRKVLALNNFL